MSSLFQYLAFTFVLAASLLSTFYLIKWSYTKYRHLHINDIQDFSKHHYRYLLYFFGVGIFIPATEIILEIFKIREQSELSYNLLAGAACLGIGFLSKYFKILRRNLHRIFVLFFVIFNILSLHRISYNPTELLTLGEFTIFTMISYYVFYKVEYFYAYFIIVFGLLVSYCALGLISTEIFIIYFNSLLITFTINYVIHFIDLSIKENLFFAYNIFNRGNLLVIGVNDEGSVVFVSENIKDILRYDKEEWIGKNWYNEMINIADTEEIDNGGYLQKIMIGDGEYKLIEWREEPSYNNQAIKIGRDITESHYAKIELKRTKEILEQTNRVARVGGWEVDLTTHRTYWADITKEIHEVSADFEPDIEKGIAFIKDVKNQEVVRLLVKRAIEEGIPYMVEFPIITAKGNEIWVKTIGQVEFEDGKCKRIYGAIQDIDEQVKAKNALIKSEEQFRFISENTSDVIIVFDYRKVVYISPSHEKLFGYSSVEAIEKAENSIFNFVHPDEKERVKNIVLAATVNRKTSFSYTYLFLHKDGHYVWREDSVNIIFDGDGVAVKTIVVARDVNERKRIEEINLQRQKNIELQNKVLVKLSTTPFTAYGSLDKCLESITESVSKILNISRVSVWNYQGDSILCETLYIHSTHEHLSGNKILATDYPKYFEGINSEMAIVANDAATHEHTHEFASQYLKPLSITSMLDIPIRVDGKFIGILCCEQTVEPKYWTDDDVTFARSIADIISLTIEADRRRNAEIELQRAKDLLEQTNRFARVGGWEFDFITKNVYFSKITQDIFEISEVIDLDFTTSLCYFEGVHKKTIANVFERCMKLEIPYDIELQIRTHVGNKLWIRVKGMGEFENNRCKRIYGIVQDIDEKFRLNKIIEDKELQYRTLLSHISSVTFRCLDDKDWTMVFISDAIEALSGYPASDFINNHKRSYASIVHPEDIDSLNNTPVDSSPDYEYSIEYRIIDKNNNILWVHESGKQYFSKTHQCYLLDGIITNITERKEAESQLLQNQQSLLYKSKVLAAIAKITEKLLISTNIEQTLYESFILIGEAINVDRVYYFENNIKTNLISQKVEWVRNQISSQITNLATQNQTFEDIYFYTEPLLQNNVFQNTLSELDDEKIIARWNEQGILSVLLLPVFVKNTFHGFIGFDDCTHEQLWSLDELNILQSLATNIANAIERVSNEQTIKESENNFRQINETIEDVFLLFDFIEKKYIYVSPSCEKVLDANQAFFYSGRSYVEEYMLEEDQEINSIIEGQLLRSNSSEIEYRIQTRDRQIRWIHQKSFAIHNSNGDLVRISGICSDITEKKLNQNEIKQLSLVAEKITNGVLIADTNGRILWANQAYLDMMEITFEASLNKRPRDLFNPQNPEIQSKIEIFSGNNFSIEFEIETFKKNKKWIEVNNTAIRDEKGSTIQQIEVVIDITERKKAETKLIEERKLLRAIIDNIPLNIYVKDTETKKIMSNETDVRYSGFEKESEVIGKTDFELFEDDSAQSAYNDEIEVMQNNKPLLASERLHIQKNGDFKWLLVSKIPLIDEQQIVTGLVGISVDITERKKSQQLLEESEHKLNSILNALDEIVWAVNLSDYKLLFVSKSFEKIYGINIDELKSDLNIWRNVIYPDDKEIAKKSVFDLMNLGASHNTYRIIDGAGNVKWIENDVKIVQNDNGVDYMIMGITTDITDKKLAEQALVVANEQADAANKSKAELELRALQMQMNPHFVFNALNSIQSYIMSHDALTANNYLSKFAHLIRLFLDSSRSRFISLEEEVRLLKLYIELEKLRFTEKFDFEIVLDANVSKYFEIPTMILQPFVENAINHGLRYKKEKGLLSIRFYYEAHYLICKIEDDGVGRKRAEKIQAKSSKGYKSQGLKITAERLMAYNKINEANIDFSVNDKIANTTDPNAEVGTVIEIRFPEN
jgi:PAS domain S-box-containing protein